jgi:hypothetical protein
MGSDASSSINRAPTKSELVLFKKFIEAKKLDLEAQSHEIESKIKESKNIIKKSQIWQLLMLY